MPPGSGRGKARPSGSRKSGPRGETPQVERREVRVPVTRHAAPQGAKDDQAPFGAPLPHGSEGRKRTADPEARLRASSPRYGRTNDGDDDVCPFECGVSGCLKIFKPCDAWVRLDAQVADRYSDRHCRGEQNRKPDSGFGNIAVRAEPSNGRKSNVCHSLIVGSTRGHGILHQVE